MRRDFNEIIRDWLNNDDLFWCNSTITPFLHNIDKSKNDYGHNLPSTNIYEDEWSYKYELSTPGFIKKDLNIELENNILIVMGERKNNNKKDNGEYITKEYHSNKFYRSFNLPENVVADEVHAKVENGITTLFMPKEKPTKAKNLSKTIEIS